MTDITRDDFITGIICGCALRDVRSLDFATTTFYHAVMDAFRTAQKYAEVSGAQLRFWMTLDELYEDSADISEGFHLAAYNQIFHLDPTRRSAYITMTEEEAEACLKRLPGDRAAYLAFADAFLSGMR